MMFKTNDEMIIGLAVKNNMDMDKVVAAYLISGDQFFMLLHALEGQDIKIPSERRLCMSNLNNIRYIEDDERKYSDCDRLDVVIKDDKSWSVVAKEKKVLNHWYLPVIEVEG